MEEDKERLVNKKLAALIGALLIYICFFFVGKNVTIQWQSESGMIGRLIVWFCSVVPAFCESIGVYFYFSVNNKKNVGIELLVLIGIYVCSYGVIFLWLFVMSIIMLLFESLGIGVFFLLLLSLGGIEGTIVVIILK